MMMPSPKPFSFSKENLLPQEEKLEVGKKQKQFLIGVLKESKEVESRVSLTPLAVELLINNGHQVIIESGAGKAANFLDNHYSEKGGLITENSDEIFKSDIVMKISPFLTEEIDKLKENQLIFSILHLKTKDADYFKKIMSKKVTAIALEYIKDENDCYTIVRSMSEIAGSTSILIAAEYLSNVHDGKGEMLGGITGVNPSEVVILGAGTAGEFAARTALGLGALVKVFDGSSFKLKRMQNNLGQRIYTSVMQPKVLSNALKTADVVIGAMRLLDHQTLFYVTEDMVRNMKKGSVIIDISIDEGGCFETSEIRDHKNPVFIKHGVIHYCVPNIASRVARTASYALSNIMAPLLVNLGKSGGIKQLLKEDVGLRNGIYIFNGTLSNNYIGNIFGMPSKDINLLVAAF